MGDITQAAAQTLGSSISGFDLATILLQIHPQVTTRKLLLVGHSQGAFYANEMYEYLLAHGEPKAAVGVYHVGTPASSVAGGGKYLTSSNDSIINAARTIASSAKDGLIPLAAKDMAPKAKAPLPANIALSSADYGHGFSSVYLAEAPERVVGDIQSTLKNLKAEAATETGECFTAPSAGLSYQVAKAGFAAGDAAAAGIKAGAVAAGQGLAAVAQGAYGVASKIVKDIGSAAGGLAEISQAADGEHTSTNFDIFSKLYGSSLTKDEYRELLGSAVATAPALVQAPAPAPQAAEGVQTYAPKKITYLSGGNSRSDDDEQQETEAPTEGVESVVPPKEVVVPTEPEPDPVPDPEPAPEPSPLIGMVVINELAWAGGYSAPTDQWVELYNRAPYEIDLSVMSLSIGGVQTPLSGILPPGYYLVVERTDDSVRTLSGFPYATTINFGSLAEPTQVSLVLADGTVVDATPAAGACGGTWCAGGMSTSGYADWHGNPFPVSMERIDMDEAGTDPANWAGNDGYTRHHFDAMQQWIVGTPGNQNSEHWPLVGFSCGGNSIAAGAVIQPEDAGGSCMVFMGGASYWKSVGGGIFAGQVGSATDVSGIYFPGRFTGSNQKWGTAGLPELVPGEYFVAMWEYDNNIGSGYNTYRIGDMYSYLKTGAPQDPGLSYVIIPFTVEGEETPAPAVQMMNVVSEDAGEPAEQVPVDPVLEPVDDALAQDTPTEDASVEDTSTKDAPVEDGAQEDIAPEDAF